MAKFAFVFPGQGSQAVGMLNALAESAAVKMTLQQASAALGYDMAELIQHGPVEQLNLTTNTQPVMLAASYAVYQAWLEAGGRAPDVVAGHSLGEYTALVVAGVLSFADALKTVRYRAQVMQDAVPVGVGGMAAILGLSDEDVQAACVEANQAAEVVEAVNFNAPAQVVIAGHAGAVNRACEIAKAKGAKRALPLPVSAPFHSSLMKPAADKLEAYLKEISFSAPAIPLVNNIDVLVQINPVDIRQALVRQAYGPVRWVESVQAIAAMGVVNIVECGPGKVLAGLVKRISADVTGLAMFDPNTIEQAKGILS